MLTLVLQYLLMDEEDDLLTAEDRLRASGKFFMLARLLEKLKAVRPRPATGVATIHIRQGSSGAAPRSRPRVELTLLAG